ncbi:hypothetical protein ACS0PU_009111 [Formica fusca]
MFQKPVEFGQQLGVQPEKESEGDSTGLSKIVEVRSGAAFATDCKQHIIIRPRYKAVWRGGSLVPSVEKLLGFAAFDPSDRFTRSGAPPRSLRPPCRGCRFWSLSVAAVASCCSQHASRPDLKSGRGRRRLLPRRFLIGSHISGVGEGILYSRRISSSGKSC